jgi:NAD(P)-dependent dehydrogenase (short-subunit alcohol dehydrogenase family)
VANVVVTGASTGIGRACALRLDELGHRVFAGVRSDAAAADLRAAASSNLVPLLVDVTEPDQVAAAAAQVSEVVGDAGLDGLVNNAGVALGGPVEYLPLDRWRTQFEVNVLGQVAVTQAFLPAVRTAVGRIVFVGSVAGRVSAAFGAPYGASKHAVAAVAQSLRQELHPWGIGVSLVEPGLVSTPIWDKGTAEVERLRAELGEECEQRYGEAMRRLDAKVAEAGRAGRGPERVVEAVEHALFDPRPRLRYPAGGDAKVVALAQRLLPDRAFGWLVQRSAP